MAVDLAEPMASTPGTDLARFIPAAPPLEWELGSSDDLVHWDFLDAITDKPVRPWLVVRQRTTRIGDVRWAVPRLMPEADWADSDKYMKWEESCWKGEVTPLAAVSTVAEAAAALPASVTRPKWANYERLVDIAVRADLHGMSAARIVAEDGQASWPGERDRVVRSEITRARAFMAAIGALPWAGFANGQTTASRKRWWLDPAFATALANWRHDATNLSWRCGREGSGNADPTRDAAVLFLQAPWNPPDPETEVLARGRLEAAVRIFEGSREEWLESLIAYPHQTAECRRDLVQRSDQNGSASGLRAIWREVKDHRPDPVGRDTFERINRHRDSRATPEPDLAPCDRLQ